ncbi:MAG: bifunctional 2-methylcitrate dehydratase/aconitate hydratase [Burkholderiales bacterium]|nr:bifunctional 2-methylcitrate dehydratase/aconitate hydratase [Burkholderiales bacterium]
MSAVSNVRPAPDAILTDIADYVIDHRIDNSAAYQTARYCFNDALGCAFEALEYPECTRFLGPVVPETSTRLGARVPGTNLELDPASAAFNLGTMIRWLDSNDCFLAAERGHPSDNLGAILTTADFLSRRRSAAGKPPLTMREVLVAQIKAYEIQGGIGIENSFTRIGCDHAALIRVASAAVISHMLGGNREQIIGAVSNAWADGLTLKAYRQAPNVGSRKNWAGGDATSRGVQLALLAMKGDITIPSVMTARKFGFYEALYKGQTFTFQRPYGSYVMENILFKFVPADMLTQTAVECALKLHPLVKDRIAAIEGIIIRSQEAMIGINDKTGPLHNPADRDHCAQYVVAVALLFGRLISPDLEDEFASNPEIDQLREKIRIAEEPRYSRDFYDPEKRSSANALEIKFRDGGENLSIEIEYPLGHPRRRAECLPVIEEKFRTNLARRFSRERVENILQLCNNHELFEKTPVNSFMDLLVM